MDAHVAQAPAGPPAALDIDHPCFFIFFDLIQSYDHIFASAKRAKLQNDFWISSRVLASVTITSTLALENT
jgi:hypothetical protein